MRKLYEQDIIEILYGATLLGAGGGGSLKQGLGMLEGLKKDGNQIELDLLDLDENKKAFIPFITGGDPSLDVTKKLILAMQEAGADLIEVGIPFSDPIAEGPVIHGQSYFL